MRPTAIPELTLGRTSYRHPGPCHPLGSTGGCADGEMAATYRSRTGPAIATILGDSGMPSVSVVDPAPVAEPRTKQAAAVVFKITLSAPTAQKVTLRASTVNGTAIAGLDYI